MSRWDAKEVLHDIFSHLVHGTVLDLITCVLVCKRWRDVIESSTSLWTSVSFRDHAYLDETDDASSVEDVAKRARKHTRLSPTLLHALLNRHGSKVTTSITIAAPFTVAADDQVWQAAMALLNAAPCKSLTLAAPLAMHANAYSSLRVLTGLERFDLRSLKCSNRIIRELLRSDTSSQLLSMDLSNIPGIFQSGVSMEAIRKMTRLETLRFDNAELALPELLIPLVSSSYSLLNYSARNNLELSAHYYLFECTCTRLQRLELAGTWVRSDPVPCNVLTFFWLSLTTRVFCRSLMPQRRRWSCSTCHRRR
jgi:hypothetical protein